MIPLGSLPGLLVTYDILTLLSATHNGKWVPTAMTLHSQPPHPNSMILQAACLAEYLVNPQVPTFR